MGHFFDELSFIGNRNEKAVTFRLIFCTCIFIKVLICLSNNTFNNISFGFADLPTRALFDSCSNTQ